MNKFWILRAGKPVALEGEIAGELATVKLPLGGFKSWRWPRWYASREDALAAITQKHEKRLERARRLLEAEGVSQ